MEAVSLLGNAEPVPDLEIEGTLFCFKLSLVQHHAVTLGGLSRMCVTGPARADMKNSITTAQLCAVCMLLPRMFTKLLLNNERTFENISF